MSDEEHLDIDPCDKDKPKEKADQNVTPKAVKKTTKATAKANAKSAEKAAAQAADDEEVAKIRALMTPEQIAKLLAADRAQQRALAVPRGEQTKIHKGNLDQAMVNIEETMEYIKAKHDGKYFELHMLMLYCDEWKQVPFDADEDFDKFTKWLGTGDTKTNLGLSKKGGKAAPSASPSIAGSKSVSRGVTPFVNEDEDEEAGAGAK